MLHIIMDAPYFENCYGQMGDMRVGDLGLGRQAPSGPRAKSWLGISVNLLLHLAIS